MIELPWPARELSPNFRSGSHHARARAAKKARGDAAWATMAARIPALPATGPIPVALAFHPDCNRHRDMDNLIASMKPALDGVADALGVNDSRFVLSASLWPPASRARVVVTIGEPRKQCAGNRQQVSEVGP